MEKNKDLVNKCFKYAIILILFWWCMNNLNMLGSIGSKIVNTIFPFILGGAIAFIVNIPMSFFEKKLSKLKKNASRAIAFCLSIIIIFCVIYLIINLILPELINIINMLIDNVPYYSEEIGTFIEKSSISDILKDINLDTENLKNQILETIPNLLSSSITIVGTIISVSTNIVMALIFAVFLLIGKDKIIEQMKKIMHAYLSEEKVEKIINIGDLTNKTFRSFFTVQCLEATILGVLCILGMLVLRVPYAVPIGILIGVTALIPVVGAFIGITIGAILIVAVQPYKVITFVIFVIILQQIEGNLIYPKVVGGKVGLPGILVFIAVAIGGSLYGIVGMLVSVPITSVIYTIVKKDVTMRLDEKNKEEEGSKL